MSAAVLSSHRGWDAGALEIAKILAAKTRGKLFYFEFTRLCIDANRSLDNGGLRFDGTVSEKTKMKKLFLKYRNAISRFMKSSKRDTLAFSIHSFTPRMKGKTRTTDIGILFRPWIRKEAELALKLKKSLQQKSSGKLAIHFNKPYRGHTDCLLNDVLDVHKRNPHVNGLFIEINQRIIKNKKQIAAIGDLLAESIVESTES